MTHFSSHAKIELVKNVKDDNMLRLIAWLASLLVSISVLYSGNVFADPQVNIAILCYHNLSPTTPGSMNMTPQKFEAEMQWLKDNGFSFITLNDAVDYLQGRRATLPPKPVVLTADDGWQSVYTYMFPIVRKLNIPVTLFIYPGTISEGKHALTWDELKQLKQTGLFEIQGHTYTHPNFKIAKRHLSPAAYDKFVKNELVNSKKVLEDKLGVKISYLAWPFGIYNNYLEQQAKDAGYVMAFTIGGLGANRSFAPMEQPRFMIIDAESMKTFQELINGAVRQQHSHAVAQRNPKVNEKLD